MAAVSLVPEGGLDRLGVRHPSDKADPCNLVQKKRSCLRPAKLQAILPLHAGRDARPIVAVLHEADALLATKRKGANLHRRDELQRLGQARKDVGTEGRPIPYQTGAHPRQGRVGSRCHQQQAARVYVDGQKEEQYQELQGLAGQTDALAPEPKEHHLHLGQRLLA